MKYFNKIKDILFLLPMVFFIACTSSEHSNSAKIESKEVVSEIKVEFSIRPNIVLILCDDLGYADLGFNGSKEIKTPKLDELAYDGTKFSAAYVAHPFCGPSRAGIMTGRYAHTIGAQFNLPPNSETIGKGIDLNEKFISKMLQESGYRTGLVGKWHLGAADKYHPNKRGFDDFYGFLGGGHNYFPRDYKAKYKAEKVRGAKVIRDYLTPLEHNGNEVLNDNQYLTDVLSQQGVRFINESSNNDDPFFLFMSYNAPHTPLEAKKEDMEVFSYIKNDDRRTYAAMVHAVDRGVGKIVESLKATGKYENTLIVFLSDNGGKLSKGANNFPLKEGKGSVYEGGFRIPMFFHWKGVVPSGNTYNHSVSALDLYPTFAKLAGGEIPSTKILDGTDIWNAFMLNKEVHVNDYIFSMRHREGYTDVSVRKNEWKAVKVQQQKWKLFNIETDIGESKDISATNTKILEELVSALQNWSKSHIQPKWWHNKITGEEWKEDEMPHFDSTFELN